MTDNLREIIESPLYQGKDESIRYSLTTTPWGGTPSSPAVSIYDQTGTDVSATNLSGTCNYSGDVIVTPFVTLLEAGKRYRIEIKFTSGGNTFEAYGYVRGEL